VVALARRPWERHNRSVARTREEGTSEPTSLTTTRPLPPLCYGWIDGQLAKGDERTFGGSSPEKGGQRVSKRNTVLAERLIREERMQPQGLATIDRAKADGSWGEHMRAAASKCVDFAAALAGSAMLKRCSIGSARQPVCGPLSRDHAGAETASAGSSSSSMLAQGETILQREAERRG